MAAGNAFKSIFPYLVTGTVLGAAIGFRSVGFAAVTASILLIELVAEIIREKVFAMKNITLVVPDAVGKKQLELESRVLAIELDRRNRGF